MTESDDTGDGTNQRQQRPSRRPFRFRSEPPPPKDEAESMGDDDFEERRSRVESLVRDVIRKALERGTDTINIADSVARNVSDLKLPKEVVSLIFSQIDDTKNGLLRAVSKEVRDFLEATDIATEIQRALTSLAFEVRTEIKFVPNDKGGIKPKVTNVSTPKRTQASKDKEVAENDTGEEDEKNSAAI